VHQVNQLVKQFGQMQKVMRQLSQGKMPSPSQLARGR
jgi:signal recognition particle GTPase